MMLTLGNRKLILASKSPRREQLLKLIGMEFEVMESGVSETLAEDVDPVTHVLEISRRKALDVARRVDRGIVVGADTVVVLGQRILGKPRDEAEAREMLRLLSGRTHQVYTGFTLVAVPEGKTLSEYEKTDVSFRPLESDEIDFYVRNDCPLDKAGAYAIQDRGALFVESLRGCYYNVVGFPLTKFYRTLKRFLQELGDE